MITSTRKEVGKRSLISNTRVPEEALEANLWGGSWVVASRQHSYLVPKGLVPRRQCKSSQGKQLFHVGSVSTTRRARFRRRGQISVMSAY
ncbi:hypothetical protein SERLA73DRAFT_185416 [Serpula lacrymans var. lacrymans S7.3]|uniref:Uncharacterized protein n=2 Tax=Serpula lacrymans var. lacrymans TaxID=341189 RepID=F8Q5S5_SERL3|nr:uncharacterized protein SERLADRAFT_473899 [Serpula lacrymans var. lacrymans S7.9]EGN95963.1 hypothetical protein SERLA73DRAFT_185416 [Serpula lacrymans var. lacrymans S7.3]EGO21488.1 hypothetical protein SERLADRAFT_473899 [Serpula lacrymans var. lacrymans S7.9]